MGRTRAGADASRRSFFFPSVLFLVVFVIWAAWGVAVYTFQTGWLPFYGDTSASIEHAGQFGDAFGALASLMTAVAAAAALSAFWGQRREAALQEFERNFFTLIANLQSHVEQIDVHAVAPEEASKIRRGLGNKDPEGIILAYRRSIAETKVTITGRDALRFILRELRLRIFTSNLFGDSKSIHRTYREFYNFWHDDLGHYFRTLYHIFKMIDEECPRDKMRYARIARSHISSSEIILLGYNCSVGEGRHKFKKYVRDFRLLHNYHVDSSSAFCVSEKKFMERMIGVEAFGDQIEDVFTY